MEPLVQNSVYEHRSERSMTQEILAEKVRVSRQTIIAIEKGKYTPSVSLAMRLAHAFGVRVEDIFHFSTKK
jgi:putative transcriptional regulator